MRRALLVEDGDAAAELGNVGLCGLRVVCQHHVRKWHHPCHPTTFGGPAARDRAQILVADGVTRLQQLELHHLLSVEAVPVFEGGLNDVAPLTFRALGRAVEELRPEGALNRPSLAVRVRAKRNDLVVLAPLLGLDVDGLNKGWIWVRRRVPAVR